MRLFRQAWTIRRVEQRLLSLFTEGKLHGTVHTCIGQEWTGVAVAAALESGDVTFSNHRCHGHYLARTNDVDGLIAEVMGRKTGICGGRGGSQHLGSTDFYSNGIQGGIVPVAAGVAFAKRFQAKNEIVVVFIGDGTLGEGVVYESLNIASLWKLPLLFVLENNFYAQSTPQRQTLAGDIQARATAFGVPSSQSATENPDQLVLDVADVVRRVRDRQCPHFLQIDTYRLMGHSKGDDDRDGDEVKAHWERDPLTQFEKKFPDETQAIWTDVDRRIQNAIDAAEAADYPSADSCPSCMAARPSWQRTRIDTGERFVSRIQAALTSVMSSDVRVILLGEDIEAPYGGAFKVTGSLSQEHPSRVRNMPISEAAIVGIGNGLAMAGMRPICEIMFGDFLTLAADQLINHAAKFRYVYNDQVEIPIVVRTPVGGKRGYGATHSQSLEKHFLGIPDTLVLALHPKFDPAEIYRRLFATIDRPTLILENKILYSTTIDCDGPLGFQWQHSDETFPTSRLRPSGESEVTILCYGGLVTAAENAVDVLFEEHDVIAELVCPVQLYPYECRSLLDSVEKTRKLLIVEEGHGFAAFGAEVIAQIHEHDPQLLTKTRRVNAPDHAIPSCRQLELQLLPGQNHIVTAVLEMLSDEL